MVTILVADQIAEQGVARPREHHDVVVSTGLSEDELVEAVALVAGIVVRSQTRITARVIEAAPQLAVIGRAGVGVDNIDLDAATQRGVIVVNAPLANTISATEHAFALLLAVARNVPQGHESLRGGRWERSKLQGVELAGRTLGIVGLGRIGSEVARRARAFEMRVIAYDPFVSSERAGSLGVELMTLDELLEGADFVTLHTALHEGTQGMIGEEQLARMKPSSYLINSARGALVDEQALHEAVTAGVIAGAPSTCSVRSRPSATSSPPPRASSLRRTSRRPPRTRRSAPRSMSSTRCSTSSRGGPPALRSTRRSSTPRRWR